MPDLTLVLGDKALSSWSFRPWLALKVANIPFEEVTVRLDRPDTAERIGEVSPSGRVPVLRADRVTVWESLAICEWAAERFPDKRLWPAVATARAHARAISHEMHAGFAAVRERLPFDAGRSRTRPALGRAVEGEIARIVEVWSDARRRFGATSEDRGFLFGRFTIADAMYAPVVSRLITYGIVVEGAAGDYAAAVSALPAFVEWHEAARRERESGGE